MDAEQMPGDAEAAGAAAGMHEIYGETARGCLEDCYGRIHYVGGWLTWRREEWPAGRTASGRILEIADQVYLVDCDGEPASVTPAEVMPL